MLFGTQACLSIYVTDRFSWLYVSTEVLLHMYTRAHTYVGTYIINDVCMCIYVELAWCDYDGTSLSLEVGSDFSINPLRSLMKPITLLLFCWFSFYCALSVSYFLFTLS